MREIPFEKKKKNFLLWGGKTLSQISQRVYEISIIGDNQNLTEQGPGNLFCPTLVEQMSWFRSSQEVPSSLSNS